MVGNKVVTGNKLEETARNRALKTVADKISNAARSNRVADHNKGVATDHSRDLKIVARKTSRVGNKTVRSKGLRKTAGRNSNDLLNKVAGRNRDLIKIPVMKEKINNELISITSGFLT